MNIQYLGEKLEYSYGFPRKSGALLLQSHLFWGEIGRAFHAWCVNMLKFCWTLEVRVQKDHHLQEVIIKLLQRIMLGHLKPKTWMLRN